MDRSPDPKPAPATLSPFRWRTASWLVLAVAFRPGLPLPAQQAPDYELAPIHYSTRAPSNRVDSVQTRLASGDLILAGSAELHGLRQALDALGVAPDSQVLVFSKTSLQRSRIGPASPRAIYFSDDCYVGWVPGGLIEIAVTDPQLGLVFYRLDPRPSDFPHRFERDEDCLSCHAGPLTRQWPALLVRSVYTDPDGEPLLRAGGFLTDHTSPLAERWGGWYVTGRHGSARHMGNAFAQPSSGGFDLDREAGSNLADLTTRIPVDRYLRADSDIVALMVLEHQVGMHNRLAEAALRTRKWMHYQQALQKELGEPVSDHPTGSALRVVTTETGRLLDYLLFRDEAPLPREGVHGNPAFPIAFAINRRPDNQGRSLKDLNLETRLFQFRCSYLIYSEAFASLPAYLRQSLYRDLHAGLSAAQPTAPFDHLPAGERRAIREILLATHPEFAAAAPATPASR